MTNSEPSKKKQRTISLQQQIRNLLKVCEVNPTKPGPWQAIVATAGADYLELRALEELQRAIQSLKTENAPALQDYQSYEQHMVQATELLTLARLKRKTYLLHDEKKHVVLVTQLGLEKGSDTEVIETRRVSAAQERGDIGLPKPLIKE